MPHAKRSADSGKRMKIGAAIMLASIALIFVWGFAFDLFGHPIRFNPPVLGFFGWMLVGMFGVGYAYAGPRGGLRIAAGMAALMIIALVAGIARGAYR